MNIAKRLLKIKIIKNISYLVSGTILAIIIPLLFEPFLKRIYTPKDFGELSLFLKAFTTLVIFSSGCYEMGIMIADKDEDVKNLIGGNILINIFVFFISELVMLILYYYNFFSKKYIFFLPVSVLFYSIGITYNNYMIRRENYKEVSINKLIRRGSETILQYILKKLSKVSIGLILGATLGNFIFMLYNFRISNTKIKINISQIKKVWIKYIDFPKYYLFPQLYNTLSTSILDIVVFTKFSIMEVGYLELTNKVLSLPSLLLSESIAKVLLQETSKKISNNQSIKKDVGIVFILLSFLSIVYIIIIYFFGPFLFSLVFGENWLKSGIYAQYLILFISASFITSALSSLLLALNKIQKNSIWQIAKTSSVLSLSLFSYVTVENFLKIYSGVNTFFYIIYIILIIYEVLKYEKNRVIV